MIILFTAAVFVLDVAGPRGVPAWVLYFLPFFIVRYNRSRRFPFALAALSTVLMLAAPLISGYQGPEPMTARTTATILLWVLVTTLTRRRGWIRDHRVPG